MGNKDTYVAANQPQQAFSLKNCLASTGESLWHRLHPLQRAGRATRRSHGAAGAVAGASTGGAGARGQRETVSGEVLGSRGEVLGTLGKKDWDR